MISTIILDGKTYVNYYGCIITWADYLEMLQAEA